MVWKAGDAPREEIRQDALLGMLNVQLHHDGAATATEPAAAGTSITTCAGMAESSFDSGEQLGQINRRHAHIGVLEAGEYVFKVRVVQSASTEKSAWSVNADGVGDEHD